MDNYVDGEFYELEERLKVSAECYRIYRPHKSQRQKLISLMEKAYAASHSIMTFHMRLT